MRRQRLLAALGSCSGKTRSAWFHQGAGEQPPTKTCRPEYRQSDSGRWADVERAMSAGLSMVRAGHRSPCAPLRAPGVSGARMTADPPGSPAGTGGSQQRAMADDDRALLVWLFGFVFWAGWAPLSGAVVANGTFVATGQNKQVQHPGGGILCDLLVKRRSCRGRPGAGADGFDVGRRQAAAARPQVLQALVMRARLEAEMQGHDRMDVPPGPVACARTYSPQL